MFPVEICNLCKIKWVTSCRCVYELETLWSKQLQWSDLIYKHHGSTKLHGVTLLIMGSSLLLSECYMSILWLVSNAVQWNITGSFWSSTVARRWNIDAQQGNQSVSLRIQIFGISKNCSVTEQYSLLNTQIIEVMMLLAPNYSV